MALSRSEFRNSDLIGIIGGFAFVAGGEDFWSGEIGVMPAAPRRDERLSSAKGSFGVPGSSSVPWLLIVSTDPLRSCSRLNFFIGVAACV